MPPPPSARPHVQVPTAVATSGSKRRRTEWTGNANFDSKRRRLVSPPPTPPSARPRFQVPAAVAASDSKRRLMATVENRYPPVSPTLGAASDHNILQSFGFGKMLRGEGKGLLNEMTNSREALVPSLALSHSTSDVGFGLVHSDTTSDVGTLCKSGGSLLTEFGKVDPRVAESVVSLTSFLGPFEMCNCTGVIIEAEGLSDNVTSILTSASLLRFSDVNADNITVKVRLPNGEFELGELQYCDLVSGLAVVSISCEHDFRPMNLSSNHGTQCGSNIRAVAFGRCFDSGLLTSSKYPSGQTSSKYPREISEAWIGGPIVDINGSFVGMICSGSEGTIFIPKHTIVEWLKHEKSNWHCTTVSYEPFSEWSLEWLKDVKASEDTCMDENLLWEDE